MDPRRLREETRAEHEATEALMPLTGATLNRTLYVQSLRILYQIVHSWECWTEASAPGDLTGFLAARRRSQLLREDLVFFDASTEEPQTARVDWRAVTAEGLDRSRPVRPASLLGALYVMEGSTLGGRYIARHVESALGLQPGRGNAYFRGHGESTGALWREVMAKLAEVPPESSGEVILVARRTFEAFGEALKRGYAAQSRQDDPNEPERI